MLNKRKLTAKMVEAGYTQKSLAEAINVSPNTVNSKINGHGFFDTKQVERICEVLNIVSSKEKSIIFLGKSSHNRDETKAG